MTVLAMPPAHRPSGAPSGDRVHAALVVAITALGTLAMTQDVAAVPISVAPVLLALRLRS